MINKNVLKGSKWLFNIYLHRTLRNPKSLSLRSVRSGTVRSVTTALGEFVETTLSCPSLAFKAASESDPLLSLYLSLPHQTLCPGHHPQHILCLQIVPQWAELYPSRS